MSAVSRKQIFNLISPVFYKVLVNIISEMANSTEIVIVGAGVVGLSTALAISENLPSRRRITIIADHFPDDAIYEPEYTSPWAGAHFRPFPSKNEQEAREFKLTRITQSYFKELAKTNPESSIKFVKGIEYFEEPDSFYRNISKGYREGIDNFEVLEKDQLPDGVKIGTSYDTWVLNAPMYIQFLQRKLRFEYDIKFLKKRINSLKEVNKYVKKNPIIINCSGRGLKYEGGYDEDSFPIRGQTLLINPPTENPYTEETITHQLSDGLWTFCINRPLNGGTIIGGTKQVNDFTDVPKDEDTKELISRGSKLFPELMKIDENGKKYFDIVRINVGFRPARKNGLNLTIEKHAENIVINAYGAGGMGYELSYGIGFTVNLNLANILLSKSKL